jgi:hypothetical protein
MAKSASSPPSMTSLILCTSFDFGLIAVLEKPEDVKVYAEHPVHQKVHKLRESLADDTLAYDMVV